jgi:hypothetical protein
MVAAGSVVLCGSALPDADACGVTFRVAMDAQFASHSDWKASAIKGSQFGADRHYPDGMVSPMVLRFLGTHRATLPTLQQPSSTYDQAFVDHATPDHPGRMRRHAPFRQAIASRTPPGAAPVADADVRQIRAGRRPRRPRASPLSRSRAQSQFGRLPTTEWPPRQ